MANNTWDLVPLSKGRKLDRCKWLYRTKYALDGSIKRLKTRLFSKIFSQIEGIIYNETFSLVTKINYVHLVLTLPTSHKWEVQFKWMSNWPSCMGICKNNFTWNNLLVMFRIIHVWM